MEVDCMVGCDLLPPLSVGQAGDGIGASPAPLSFGFQRPVSELLSPVFLAMFGDGTLLSCTIWDQCLEELNAQNDGCKPATSVEDLLLAFQPILAEIVILRIQCTLEALKESSLGVQTALIPSKENILRNILTTLQEVSGGRIGGRGSGQGRGDDGDDGEALEEDRVNGQFFQEVEQVIISLCNYRTPPQGNEVQSHDRALSIAERGRLFSLHFDARADQILYNPYHTGGTACFYHGTRLAASHGFSRCGVQPFKPGTEFSPVPAFYVTNYVTAAFEFPLHNHLGKDPSDTVVVFQFDLSLGVLHGHIPPPNGERRFKVRWFESGVDRAAWEAFCNRNMYGEQPRHQHQFDIVIGAMCIPNVHTRTVVPRLPNDLLQVGFCTKAAWKWVGSCVKRMYIESRVGV